jgi:hypothetical protein
MVERLFERIDRPKRLVSTSTTPVVAQLGLVRTRPLDHQPHRPGRNPAGENGKAFDLDRDLIVAVGGVEMRPSARMDFVVVHPDDDPVEAADPRHGRRIVATVPVGFGTSP